MANQRDKNKKVLSVPMEEVLLTEIEAEADRLGINRVALINEILRTRMEAIGKLPPKKKEGK
jgi:hypothetical protein